MKKPALIIVALLVSFLAFSQGNEVVFYGDDLQVNREVQNIIINDPYALNKKIHKADLSISLELLDSEGGDNPDIELSFRLLAKKGEQLLEQVFDNKIINLTLGEDVPIRIFSKDMLDYVSGGNNEELIFSEIEFEIVSDNFDVVADKFLSNLKLSWKIEYELGFDVSASNPLVRESRLSSGSTSVEFIWHDELPIAFYELEVLKLFNTNEANVSSERHIEATVDWSKSLRYMIQPKKDNGYCTYNYSLSEGSGYYIWRIRPYSNYHGDKSGNIENFGQWSTSLTDGEAVTISEAREGYILFYSDPQDESNYNFRKVFSENSKLKEEVTYANSLNQTRQTVTYLPSSDVSIVSHNVLDNLGRPAVYSLPIPIGGKNLNFNPVFGGYSASQFDADGTVYNPSGVHIDYYEGNNDGVANAEEYPFVRKIYYNDGTGRMKEESGVGKNHRIHSGSEKDKHTARYFYGNPSETELIALFGGEAPSATKVNKTITIDANNVATITYTTVEGNVIATGLSFYDGETANLEALDDETISLDVESRIKSSSRIENGFVSSKRLQLMQATDISINYTVSNATIEDLCVTTEFDCNYSLEIKVFELKNDHSILVLNTLGGLSQSDGSGNRMANFDLSLNPGTYVIQKKLVPTDMEATTSNNANELNGQFAPITKQIKDWLTIVETREQLDEFFIRFRAMANAINAQEFDLLVADSYTGEFPFSISDSFWEDYYNKPLSEGEGGFLKEHYHLAVIDGANGGIKAAYLSTPCCVGLQIPMDWVPEVELNVEDDFDSFETMYDFEKAAADMLAEALEVPSDLYTQYMVGWDPGWFNEMVYHMVKDEYKDVVGARKIYDCNELFKCWTAVVMNLKRELTTNGETGYDPDENITVSGQYEDNYDNYKSDEEGGEDETKTHNDIFNDGLKDMSKRLQRKIKRSLSDVVKEKQGVGEDMEVVMPGIHLVEEFLNCTGYSFAKVLTTIDANPLNEDHYSMAETGFAYAFADYDLQRKPNPIQLETITKDKFINGYSREDGTHYYMPLSDWTWQDNSGKVISNNIHNPIFAFKYYQYDKIGEYVALENDVCFLDPNDCFLLDDRGEFYLIDEVDFDGKTIFYPQTAPCCGEEPYEQNRLCYLEEGYPAQYPGREVVDDKYIINEFCGKGRIICNQYHFSWNSEQLYSFYKAIENYVDPEYDEVWAKDELLCDDMAKDDEWYERTDMNIPDGAIPEDFSLLVNVAMLDKLKEMYGDLEGVYEQIVYEGNKVFPYIKMLMAEEQDSCLSNCEEKRDEIEKELRRVLYENCYQIGGCRTNNPETFHIVPDEDIELIVNALVNKCKEQCKLTSYSCEKVDCRDIQEPKTKRGGRIVTDVDLGVAGHPNATSAGYDDDNEVYFEEIDFDGDGEIDARRYKIGEYPEMFISWYENTMHLQAADWYMELTMPSKCTDHSNETVECDGAEDTFIDQSEFMINTTTISTPDDEVFNTPVKTNSTFIQVKSSPTE